MKRILHVFCFFILCLVALQAPLSALVGSKATFTLFDVVAPIGGGLFGGLFGAGVLVLAQGTNIVLHGMPSLDTASIIRLIPAVFAALYFGSRNKSILVVPLLAILLFNLHPIGGQVWYYSLFWTIPIVCYFVHDRYSFARALGATFTAHAVGGVLWLYAFSLPAPVWISLIPIVLMERFSFAVGMAASYRLARNMGAFAVRYHDCAKSRKKVLA